MIKLWQNQHIVLFLLTYLFTYLFNITKDGQIAMAMTTYPVADTGDSEPVQCTHGPWWLAAAATVPSWTLPRPIRKRCRQRSSHSILTWYMHIVLLTFCVGLTLQPGETMTQDRIRKARAYCWAQVEQWMWSKRHPEWWQCVVVCCSTYINRYFLCKICVLFLAWAYWPAILIDKFSSSICTSLSVQQNLIVCRNGCAFSRAFAL